MARILCVLAVVVLAMMLFVTYEVEASTICKSVSKTFLGLCINAGPCKKACLSENFVDGHCSKISRRCTCTKPCVFEKKTTSPSTGNALAGEAKTIAEALLEEDIVV
ncbi:hypothetical protein CQW23_08171 [Capsicum baccatum]|uniref:Knottins-like domain-containing protein n=1 Tax=Capsicum baccatum TaxID=33114 RepID=A0A2G2X8E3_CAPBA|nr:hypothetical protein CQW23_08171 [Capsicum baccatum]